MSRGVEEWRQGTVALRDRETGIRNRGLGVECGTGVPSRDDLGATPDLPEADPTSPSATAPLRLVQIGNRKLETGNWKRAAPEAGSWEAVHRVLRYPLYVIC